MYSGQKLEIVEILAGANDMTIATLRLDGYPQATTVNYVNDGVTIYFGTGRRRRRPATSRLATRSR
jgi:nitroimidazol reductase NimA-like FMN-containing flavoprotein (pyridoxamine 5'-phosphate oxidase superfamily)